MKEEKIINYITGSLDQAAQAKVEEWIGLSDNNQKDFHELRDAWVTALHHKEAKRFDADTAWDKFNASVKHEPKRRSFRKVVGWLAGGVAAAAITIFSVLNLPDKQPEMISHSYADASSVLLPDGTNVSLNENSSIKYPEEFLGDSRELAIFGEAFFDVAHNKEKPFIVHAGSYRVKVLGTEFNIKEVRSDVFEVYVKSGKVAVYHNENDSKMMKLLPGDLARLESKRNIHLISSGDNYMSWMTNELVFNNAKLDKVIQDLEEYYQKEIRFDEELGKLRLTARFEDKSLDEALNVIKVIFNIKVQKIENYILLSANSPPTK